MEKFSPEESKEYRDNLAEKVKDIINSDSENPEAAKAKASGYLEAEKGSDEYKLAKETHLKKVEDTINLRWQEKATAEERFSQSLIDRYVDSIKRNIFGKAHEDLMREGRIHDLRRNVSDEIIKEDNKKVEQYCKPLIERIDKETAAKEVLEGLKAIDEAYEEGIVTYGNELWNMHEFFEDKKIDLVEYDEAAFMKYVNGIMEKIEKIKKAFDYEGYNVKQGEYAGTDKVCRCDGGHEFAHGIYFPTSFECHMGIDPDIRLKKLLSLLKRFKKTPEQIKIDKEKIAEKNRKEKEKSKKAKEKERMDKFDPNI